MTTEEIKLYLKEGADLRLKMANDMVADIEKATRMVIDCYQNGNKLLICGNGGSAADAQHFAAEMVNRFKIDRVPLPAISLTTDPSVITSIGNDSGFDYVFEKQVRALGNSGDILIVITTSDISPEKNGHSANIFNALVVAQKKGMKTMGFISQKSKKILDYLDMPLIIPHQDTPRIQEAHIAVIHIICEIAEKKIFEQLK